MFTKTSLLKMLTWLQEAGTGHTAKCWARNVKTQTEARCVPAALRGGGRLEWLRPAWGTEDRFAWLSLLTMRLLLASVCMWKIPVL